MPIRDEQDQKILDLERLELPKYLAINAPINYTRDYPYYAANERLVQQDAEFQENKRRR